MDAPRIGPGEFIPTEQVYADIDRRLESFQHNEAARLAEHNAYEMPADAVVVLVGSNSLILRAGVTARDALRQARSLVADDEIPRGAIVHLASADKPFIKSKQQLTPGAYQVRWMGWQPPVAG